jgi:hypothetical protein
MLARRTTIGTERGRFSEAEGVVERMTGRPSQKDLSMDFEEAIERPAQRGQRSVRAA